MGRAASIIGSLQGLREDKKNIAVVGDAMQSARRQKRGWIGAAVAVMISGVLRLHGEGKRLAGAKAWALQTWD